MVLLVSGAIGRIVKRIAVDGLTHIHPAVIGYNAQGSPVEVGQTAVIIIGAFIDFIGQGRNLHAPVRITGIFDIDAGTLVAKMAAEEAVVIDIDKTAQVDAHVFADGLIR